MILPNRHGTKNVRPAMRAEYGPHIKTVVGVVPPDWVLDKGMYRTPVFLDNLEDGNGKVLKKQKIEYTDFPLDQIVLYCCPQGDQFVLMLPGEY